MKIINILQAILSFLIIFLVLIQKRGSMLSNPQLFVFGKRGLEKKIFYFTWVVAFLFLSLAILNLIL
jgi:protein translocase SecG subunit